MIELPDNSLFAVIALVISAAGVLALSPLARAAGLVDRPDDDLKDHGSDVPIVGGLAVFIALHVGLMLAGSFELWLLAVTGFLLLIGLFDDVRGLPPVVRLGAAAVAGVMLAYAVGADSDLVAAAIVVVLLIVAVNAVNLLDGADAVAGSAALVTSIGLVFLMLMRDGDAVPSLLLAGALGGFLIVNWPPAKAFLGDGGAYVVASALTFLVLESAGAPSTTGSTWLLNLLIGVSLFGVFIVDLAVTLLRRIISRQALFGGDRSHVYDQLADRGWSPVRVAVAVASTQLGIVALVLAFDLFFEPGLAAALSIGVVHLAVTILCALGFAYLPKRKVSVSELFKDPDSKFQDDSASTSS
ncbi:MAG: undecaprenyl/decaprenyl-phosphate alpha-N-acetylglucosaminyl 1-phosphate transferase [Actinobacteria bacterium]|nr:MAG: undecaprenyl/decaprenyl-phosphate alpha-N-acetylglucosaminyl 1-phosphate transferase [Actinomycetota bacterium]